MNAVSMSNFVASTSITVLNCSLAAAGGTIADVVGLIVSGVIEAYELTDNSTSLVKAYEDLVDCVKNTCGNPPPPSNTNQNSSVLGSWDPNEKIGPGYGNPSYVRKDVEFRYRVAYENADTATLPAQTVCVIDTLDVEKFDPKSVKFISAGVARKSVFFSQSGYSAVAEIDLQPQVPHKARVNAVVDTATGIIQWQVQTIDLITKQETTDPLAGFLPPNDSTNRGDGFFTFSVSPRKEWQQGDTIKNRASIIFDFNPPINTDAWVNIIDMVPPSSSVQTLPAVSAKDTILISVSGSDLMSGVENFEIWVAENDAAFQPLIKVLESNQFSFVGVYGNKYSFCSFARDRAGNKEIKVPTTEAFVTFQLAPTKFEFIGSGNFSEVANWKNQMLPPAVLPAGSEIIINPAADGECILDRIQEIRPGAKLTLAPGKKIRFLTGFELK